MAFFDLGSALGAAMAPRRRPLWGGARSIFEDPEDQPLMTDKRNPELYDLMAGNLLGADPRPVAGYSGGLPELFAPPVAPAGVPASVLATEGRAFGGIKTPLRSVPAPTIGYDPLEPRPWTVPSRGVATVGAVDAPDVNAALEGLRKPSRSITFTTPGGVERADYAADNTFLGGDYRGQAYDTLNDRPAAMDLFNRLQGGRETGVPGTPSIEGIMQNQLGGLPMSPEQKRMMAIGMQQQFSIPAAGLERERIQNENVREAGISSKLLEMASYNAQRIREAGGTEEQATNAFESTMRQAGAALPDKVRLRLGIGDAMQRPAATAPAASVADTARRDDLFRILQSAEINRGSAETLLDRLGEMPEAEQVSIIDQLMKTSRAPGASGSIADFGDEIARALAYQQRRFSVDQPYKSPVPLPFREEGGALVLPNNRRVPFARDDRPNMLTELFSSGPNQAELAADTRRRRAAKLFFDRLYGSGQ